MRPLLRFDVSFVFLIFTTMSSHPRGTSLPEFAWCISLIIILAVRRFRVRRGNRKFSFFVYTESSSLVCNRAPFHSRHVEGCSPGPDPQEAEITALADGMRQSINLHSAAVQRSVDPSLVRQTLSALGQDKKIMDFAASIPGVFGSGAVPCTTSPILSSMELRTSLSTSDPTLGSCFHDLPNTCIIPGASTPTEESRRPCRTMSVTSSPAPR